MEEDGVHTLAGVTSYGLAWRFQDKVDLKQTNSQWDQYSILHSGPGCYNGKIQSFYFKSYLFLTTSEKFLDFQSVCLLKS